MYENDYLGSREVEGGIEIGFEDSQGMYNPIFIPIPEYSLEIESISNYTANIKLLKDGEEHDTIQLSWYGGAAPIVRQLKKGGADE